MKTTINVLEKIAACKFSKNIFYQELLSKLEIVKINFSQLQEILELIGSKSISSYIQKLDLLCSQLTTIPDSIGKLTCLKELNLNNNQLTTIPDSIGNLSCLKHFRGLQLNPLLPATNGIMKKLQELPFFRKLDASFLSTKKLEYQNTIEELCPKDFKAKIDQYKVTLPVSIGNLNSVAGLEDKELEQHKTLWVKINVGLGFIKDFIKENLNNNNVSEIVLDYAYAFHACKLSNEVKAKVEAEKMLSKNPELNPEQGRNFETKNEYYR